MPRVAPARMAAFRVLLGIARSTNTHCDELLRAPAIESLAQADRNLTTALVMGVLRWQLALDTLLARYLKRKSRLDDEVAIALRMGAWQLLGMNRIPAHAAIDESVELTKASGHSSASGMVNAVLRRVAKAVPEIRLDAWAAHPAWMLERWTRYFGSNAVAAITAYDQREPEMTVRCAGREAALGSGAFLARSCRMGERTVPEGARIQ